jgi:hypothetical protein
MSSGEKHKEKHNHIPIYITIFLFTMFIFISWLLIIAPPAPPSFLNNVPYKPFNNQAFIEILNNIYPKTTSEEELIKNLNDHGFTIEGNLAEFRKNSFPCYDSWYFSWQLDNDNKIEFTGAGRSSGCL